LSCLFLGVVLDLLAEHLDLGVVEILVRRHRPDLGDQVLRGGVLDVGLVHERIVDARRRARPGRRSPPRSSRAR
jgi:hypothetical protein